MPSQSDTEEEFRPKLSVDLRSHPCGLIRHATKPASKVDDELIGAFEGSIQIGVTATGLSGRLIDAAVGLSGQTPK